MSLQVRLRHALGERLFELPDRPVEQPLIVGRAREADVKVPSVTVGNEHCALFVHEGRWVLQDTSGGATFINGQAVQGPTPLQVGDVIVLGSDSNPASIEVDPAGVAQGRSGHPAEGHEPVAPPAARPAPAAAPVRQQPAGGYHAPAAVQSAVPPQINQPQPTEDVWGNPVTPQADPFASWEQPGAATGSDAGAAPIRRSRKPAKQSSDAALILGIAVCILIIGVAGWAVYNHTHRVAEVAVKPEYHPPVVDDSHGPKNIFTGGGGGDLPKPPAHPTPVAVASHKVTTPPTDASGPEKTSDPADSTPTPPEANPATPEKDKEKEASWNEIEGWHFSPEFGLALAKFDDYRRQHPNSFTKELDAYTADALDHLWWKRIAMLCKKRDALAKQIRDKDKDIHQEPSVSFKKTLTTEKAVLDRDMALVMTHLTDEMGYTTIEIPDPNDSEMIASLTAERDADKYGAWKIRVLKFVRTNHGATPWDGEN